MSDAKMLPAPPVVSQDRQTCWAAAFESWSDATAELTGTVPNQVSAQQVIDWFESGRGLTFPSGRATPQGMTLMAGIGLMSLTPHRAIRTTVGLLRGELEKGYLYLTYFSRPGRAAHAVVCYGVSNSAIYVMDPMPGEGLVRRPANFFERWPAGWVIIGTSLGLQLSRSLQSSLGRLRER